MNYSSDIKHILAPLSPPQYYRPLNISDSYVTPPYIKQHH